MFDPSEVEHGFQPPPPPPPAEVAQAAAASEQVELPSEEAQQQAEQASPSSPEQTPSAAQAAQAPSPHQAPFSAPQPNGTPGYYAAQPAQYNPSQYQAPYQVTYYSQQVSPPPAYPNQPVPPPPYTPAQPKYKPEGLAIASMVLGICSVVLGSLVCAILALVFSSRVKSHYPNGNLGPNTTYVKVGKICGAVGLGISIFMIVLVIVALILLFTYGIFEYLNDFSYYFNY